MDINFNKSIAKYCGTDWLKQIETITGNIYHIDMDKYHKNIEKIGNCEHNIRIMFKTIIKANDVVLTKEFNDLVKTFANVSSSFDITNKTFILKKRGKKPPIEDVDVNYLPTNIIKSEWFGLIKHIESEIFHLIEKIFISAEEDTHADKTSSLRRNIYKDFTFDEYSKLIKEHPNYVSLYNCFGININHKDVYESFINIQRFSSIIINTLLEPVYDIHAKIEKSFDKTLSKVFKPEMMRKNGLTKELVINLLTQFMIAKYRSEITGNNKYFLQMLVENITEGELSQINGPRFIEIMDTINTDALEKGSKATRFTVKAKDLIKKMVEKGDVIDESLLDEVKALMEDIPDKEGELPEDVAKIYASLDELFKP